MLDYCKGSIFLTSTAENVGHSNHPNPKGIVFSTILSLPVIKNELNMLQNEKISLGRLRHYEHSCGCIPTPPT